MKNETFDDYLERQDFCDKSLSYLRSMIGSQSQIMQDLFVLCETDMKKNGFFVEFGATNGLELSNTYLLEKLFAWNGILSEPAHCWKEEIVKNRNCKIDFRCVWSETGKIIEFNEADIAELSTIDYYSYGDNHADARKVGSKYLVETVSLNDLLIQNNAPDVIDYLSIDTEGSEFDILSAFDFQKYDVRIISCEHNYKKKNRDKIFNLLSSYGYKRKLTASSCFDDWYVK